MISTHYQIMNANVHFGTLSIHLLCKQPCLLMSPITQTTKRSGLESEINEVFSLLH